MIFFHLFYSFPVLFCKKTTHTHTHIHKITKIDHELHKITK